MAMQLGLDVDLVPTDWRSGVDAVVLEERLQHDEGHRIKAVLITHNETSTGATSSVADVRAALDRAGHPALLFVDAVSSLASIDYRHDEWGVDVTIAGSQKGLMLPPGLCFNAISERALFASTTAGLPRAYWEWAPILEQNAQGFFPYTPPTNLLLGLRTALDMLFDEGLDAIFARHRRHAAATREAVAAWGLELQCQDPSAYSPTVTAVVMPEGYREDTFRQVVLERYAMSLGGGLSKLAGRVFRIGHLGDFDDLALVGALAGVELGLELAGVPHKRGGVAAALDALRAP
jgi:alanine-glyoxylate transaminase/serine-glyoxylate transaminase/serine-pyruvate transaminase